MPPVGGNFTVAMLPAAERTDRAKEGGKIDLAGKKRFFVFPNRFICVRVGKLNFSAPCPRGGQTLGCANLSVSLLAGLGYFTKVNSLPRNFARPYIIGYIILQISGLNPKIRDWFCMRWRLALDGSEKLPPAALCSLGGRLFEPHCDLHEQSMAHVAYSGHTSTTHAHIYLTTRNHNVRFVQIPNSSDAPGQTTFANCG